MFLIAPGESTIQRSLGKIRNRLVAFDYPCGEIVLRKLGEGQWLGWFSCKPIDNLHIFSNGILIGKQSFQEAAVTSPQIHTCELPSELSPLLKAILIKFAPDDDALIVPHTVTNVYISDGMVSDMQLILADARRLLPSPEGVAFLGITGYFPGNETLFQEVKRIPYMDGYRLKSRKFEPLGKFTYRANDDDALLDRLVSIVPQGVKNYVSISGGLDSRTVVYAIRQRGCVPHLVHRKSREQPVVEQLAQQMNVPLSVVPIKPPLPDAEYMLVTDAQTYAQGMNSQYALFVATQKDVWHNGHFGEAVLKVRWATAMMRLKPQYSYFQKLIFDSVLEGFYDEKINGLRDCRDTHALMEYLEPRLKFILEYYPDFRHGELARWLYFMHGLRWCTDVEAEISFRTQPVSLLGDQIALEYGISSSFYSNIDYDRLRLLLAKKMPDVTVGYANGMANNPGSAPTRTLGKARFVVGRLGNLRKNADPIIRPIQPYAGTSHRLFERYFTMPIDQLLASQQITVPVKRGAITINEVLHYLDD